MKASVIIPTKNCAAWLPHAVSSVLKQTEECEIVIVNDNSTDSTEDYLHWLEGQGHNATILYKPGVTGRSAIRNAGNQIAKGDVIFVLDADDIAAPARVKKTLAKIEKGAKFVYGAAEMMDFSGTKLAMMNADVFNLQTAIEKKTNGIVHSTVAYTKEIALQFPYSTDPEISDNGLDDWEMQLRIAEAKIPMDFISTPIAAYRVLDSAISSQRDPNVVLKVKEKYLQKYMVTA